MNAIRVDSNGATFFGFPLFEMFVPATIAFVAYPNGRLVLTNRPRGEPAGKFIVENRHNTDPALIDLVVKAAAGRRYLVFSEEKIKDKYSYHQIETVLTDDEIEVIIKNSSSPSNIFDNSL